jgi:hypothetical protein
MFHMPRFPELKGLTSYTFLASYISRRAVLPVKVAVSVGRILFCEDIAFMPPFFHFGPTKSMVNNAESLLYTGTF